MVKVCSHCKKREPGCSVNATRWKPADVMCVGLSAKPDMLDLDPRTRTGSLVVQMELEIGINRWHKTNLVKYAPLGRDQKLRYPTVNEMMHCFNTLKREISAVAPLLIICLGTIVSRFLLKEFNIGQKFSGFGVDCRYMHYDVGRFILLPVHHPAYVSCYKHKILDKYIKEVCTSVDYLINSKRLMI